jgi:hypothetical protein
LWGIALFSLVLGLILNWYIEPETSTQKKDLVQALGFITAGVAGAVGIYFTWRSQRLARQAQEENQRNTLAQLENAEEQLRLTRRGQITERFTRAIDQLGSESLEIRLGGIYSLERTAREDRDYHWPIMEALTTYVRTHAPRKPEEDVKEITPPEPEIQAILTVISRRSAAHEDVEYGPIDLSGTDLQQTHLEGANLREARLEGADLRGAYLWGADLEDADLSEADLIDADASWEWLSAAHLEGAAMPDGSIHG